MSVSCVFFEHINFGGRTSSSDSGNFRYFWNRYGSANNDLFSSMTALANGNRGNIYAFEHINFDGRFAALNVGGKFSKCWWSYFGDDFNDKVSSSLLVARNAPDVEREIALAGLVAGQFGSIFDAKTQGKPVSRNGDTQVFGTFFPDFDRNNVFATIHQDLNVQVRIPLKIEMPDPFADIDLGTFRWSDYRAFVRYHVRFFVVNGKLRAHTDWVTIWVESGPFSKKVHDELKPELMAAASDLDKAMGDALDIFAGGTFKDAYLLPGFTPDMNLAGFKGQYNDGVTLVAVR